MSNLEEKTDNTEMSSNTPELEAEVTAPVAQVENKTSEEETTSDNQQVNSGQKLKKVFSN